MSNTALILIPVALCTLSLLLLSPILLRLCRRCRPEEITPEWLESFSAASYYPMQGLLADEDFRFLSRQPGFDFSLYRKLRRDRLNIFRCYLKRLIRDFNRLHTAARVLLAQGHEDASSLLPRLFWLKVRFSSAVMHAEVSYLLCRIGLGSLATKSLILRLEQMSAQLNTIAGVEAAA